MQPIVNLTIKYEIHVLVAGFNKRTEHKKHIMTCIITSKLVARNLVRRNYGQMIYIHFTSCFQQLCNKIDFKYFELNNLRFIKLFINFKYLKK